jgi:hypothetical protein
MIKNKKDTVDKLAEQKKKKKYTKPELKSEKILVAGLGASCNGTTSGSRKSATPTCRAGSLKT